MEIALPIRKKAEIHGGMGAEIDHPALFHWKRERENGPAIDKGMVLAVLAAGVGAGSGNLLHQGAA